MNGLMQTTEVLAYIDLGILSMVYQVLIGILFAILISCKIFWNSVKNFLKSLFSVKEKHGETES